MELKNSKTEKNLEAAFAGESMARSKYTFFAAKARRDGFNEIAEIFEETARNEEAHASVWFKLLCGEPKQTAQNLSDAADGECYEHTQMYSEFAKTAKEEGFDQIAGLFEEVAKIEQQHEQRFRKLLKNVNGNLVFSKENDVVWECSNCGHICIGRQAPEVCPVCSHPQAYFKVAAASA